MIFARLFFTRIQESFFYEFLFSKKSLQRKDVFFSLLFLTVLGIGGAFFCIYLYQMYRHLVIVGLFGKRPDIVFFAASLLGWIVIFFTAIPRASKIFFHDPSTPLLHTLPVSVFNITFARFLYFYFSIIPIQLIFGIPALAAYLTDIYKPVSVIGGTISFLLIAPLLPMGIALGMAFILDRIFNVSRWRLLFEALSLLCAFVVLVGVQLILQTKLLAASAVTDKLFILQLAEFLKNIIVEFPPALWVALSYNPVDGYYYSIILFLCAAGLVVPVFLLIRFVSWRREALFLRNKRKKRKLKIRNSGRILPSLLFREWKVLVSNSHFFTEIIMKLAVFPALLLFYSIAGPREYISILVSMVSNNPFAAIAAVGIMLLLLDVSTVSATSISREKRSFLISMLVPVTGRIQIKAKLILHFLISVPSYALSAGLLYFIFALPVETIIVVIPGIFGFIIYSFCTAILFELRRPVPSFQKQGSGLSPRTHVFLATILQLLFLAGSGLISYGAYLIGMGTVMTGLLIAELIIVIDFFLLRKIFRNADAMYLNKLYW